MTESSTGTLGSRKEWVVMGIKSYSQKVKGMRTFRIPTGGEANSQTPVLNPNSQGRLMWSIDTVLFDNNGDKRKPLLRESFLKLHQQGSTVQILYEFTKSMKNTRAKKY